MSLNQPAAEHGSVALPGQGRYPCLEQVNARVWLNELSEQPNQPLALDRVPDEALDRLTDEGFDWLWLMGVWQTGPAGRAVSRGLAGLGAEAKALLPDLREDDICGSPFAVRGYTAHSDFGGDEALARFRRRLHDRGLRLMLDFVGNHTAPDHPWVWDHPEYYIQGGETDLAHEPENYCRAQTWYGPRILAHGRDPYFPGWPDTLQLNYRHPALRLAMRNELAAVAERCDGVRCDMAMLLLPDVFVRTWGDRARPADGAPAANTPFWAEAIAAVRERAPQFVFLAEAYWDLEFTLQQQGFDYTYDKRLYDRLRSGNAEAVRGHLHADLEYQRKSARFLENHDEPRAAAVFPWPQHQAAAVIAFLVPGLRLFQDGQLEGRRERIPVHLGRRPEEAVDRSVQAFYGRLLDWLRRPEVQNGRWQLLECRQAGADNSSYPGFIAFTWDGRDSQRLLVAVNYAPRAGQCLVPLPLRDFQGRTFLLRNLTGTGYLERSGDELAGRGLFLDLPGWGYQLFEVGPR
jgi:hypothetical protein